jgi:hypothetical protein
VIIISKKKKNISIEEFQLICFSSNCLSTSTKSATLPCRTREKKSLLDDSVLADSMTEETRSSKLK